MAAKKKNMNMYIEEVFKQFVAIKDEDNKKSRRVFDTVFKEVHHKMSEKCQYFRKYGKEVMYAGSVYDGIKVSKLDEFDMDIVIRLPICKKDGPNGIIIENEQPGYVKMKILNALDYLVKQKDWEDCHVVTHEWRDEESYLVQNEFRNWIHGLVHKALNDMGGQVTVDQTTYLVTYREAGPAYTLNVRNVPGNEEFILDVDLVPVIKFALPRWPDGYRQLERSVCRDWLVVPKPIKLVEDKVMKNRCWRLSFQEFEHEMMKGCHQLKMAIRLVKKLRDVLRLKAISSYYIKTLFLWEIHGRNNNKSYWDGKISNIFIDMVLKLHNAIKTKEILYFWNDKFNLIEHLNPNLQEEYVNKLERVYYCLKADHVDRVLRFLLTEEEFEKFNNSDQQTSNNSDQQTSNNSDRQTSNNSDQQTSNNSDQQTSNNSDQQTSSSTGSSSPVVNTLNEPESRGLTEPPESPETTEAESPETTEAESPETTEAESPEPTEPNSAATNTGLADHASVLSQIAGLNVIFVAYLNHETEFPQYEELKSLKDRYHELEERIWVQEGKLDKLESEKGYREMFAALSSAFDQVMDDAVNRGEISGFDGEPKRWRIKDEEEMYARFAKEIYDPKDFDPKPSGSGGLQGILGDTTAAASYDDGYRPAIGDSGHSVKYKLFKFFLSAIGNVGSNNTDNTGLRTLNQ